MPLGCRAYLLARKPSGLQTHLHLLVLVSCRLAAGNGLDVRGQEMSFQPSEASRLALSPELHPEDSLHVMFITTRRNLVSKNLHNQFLD